MLNEEICRYLLIFEEETSTFFQSKTINVMGKKPAFSLRLSSTYYTFGCKNYIYKKIQHEE